MAKRNEFYETGRDAMLQIIDDLRQGRPVTRRDVEIPDPPDEVTAKDVVRLRKDTFGVSQFVFSRLLNVSVKTVQGWEQGRSKPAGATLRLLRVAQASPDVLLARERNLLEHRPRRRSVGAAASKAKKVHLVQGTKAARGGSKS